MFSQTQASAAAATAKVSRLMEKPRQQTPALENRSPLQSWVALVCCTGPLRFLLFYFFCCFFKEKKSKQNKNQNKCRGRAEASLVALQSSQAASKAKLAELREVWLRYSSPGHKLTLLLLSPQTSLSINSQLEENLKKTLPTRPQFLLCTVQKLNGDM